MDRDMRIRWKLAAILLLAGLLLLWLFFTKEQQEPEYSGEMVKTQETELLTKELAGILGWDEESVRLELGEHTNEEDWYEAFDRLLTYHQVEQIRKETLELIGDERVVREEDFPKGRILCRNGEQYVPALSSIGELTYRCVTAYVSGERLLAVQKTQEAPFCFENAFVEEADERGITFFYRGYQLYHPDGSQNAFEIVADLSFCGEALTQIDRDKEIVSGKTLLVTEQEVTLEGVGTYSFAEQCEGYLLKETVRNADREELPIGYAYADYILEDGRICAFLILPTEELETIRVAIHNSDYQGLYHQELRLSSPQELQLTYTVDGAEVTEKLPAGGELCLQTDSPYVKEGMLKVENPTNSGKIELLSVSRSQGTPFYRGNLEIRRAKEGLLLVNEVLLEEYLYAVVPSEMPSTYPQEGLKAQAVCARTYAYGYLLRPGLPELGAHVDDSVNYQVYNNIMEKKSSTDAVRQTAGELLLYGGEPVHTYYYSTSCGYGTDDTIWKKEGEEALPYLQAMHITREMQEGEVLTGEELAELLKSVDPKDYESEEPWYRWSYTVPKLDTERLIARLKQCGEGAEDYQVIRELNITERGAGGIAKKLCAVTDRGEVFVEGEYDIRYVLNQGGEVLRQDGSSYPLATILPSAYIVLETEGGKKGLTGFSVTGGGFGHGVGMSQNGARAMAQDGKSYHEILQMFYQGCELAKKY